MALCSKCGVEIPEEKTLCANCEANSEKNVGDNAAEVINDAVDKLKTLNNTADFSGEYNAADVANNKIFAILSYIFILFIVPLIAAPKSKFARFHANQGIVLFIAEVILSVALSIVQAIIGWTFLGIILDVIGMIIGLAELALMIIGIVNAATGKAKELPIIGKIRILK